MPTRAGLSRLASAALGAFALVACGSATEPAPAAPAAIEPEAGFLTLAPRAVALAGKTVKLEATAKLFYNFEPADDDARDKPIFILFNGFSAEVVRSFGTGRATVAEGGLVVANPASLTSLANLLYVEPRQAGFSYDVLDRAPSAADCSSDVFNEYVDAADVLLAVLQFLDHHAELTGPIIWVGESYAGVRVQWILAYARDRFALAPYADATLADAIRSAKRSPRELGAAQLLLEPWLVGRAHADAINAACSDPALVAAVETSVGATCSVDACTCATQHDRSLYNFGYSSEHQIAREREASLAHVTPDRVERLLGVKLETIPGLAARDREKGFRCSPADNTVPPEDELVAALGELPKGERYYVPYAPLQPGKEVSKGTPDWRGKNLLATAFVDALATVPAFVTDGARDLVVPTRALVPALQNALGPSAAASGDALSVMTPGGARSVTLGRYPEAGHMITMIAPDVFRRDVAAWLPAALAR